MFGIEFWINSNFYLRVFGDLTLELVPAKGWRTINNKSFLSMYIACSDYNFEIYKHPHQALKAGSISTLLVGTCEENFSVEIKYCKKTRSQIFKTS